VLDETKSQQTRDLMKYLEHYNSFLKKLLWALKKQDPISVNLYLSVLIPLDIGARLALSFDSLPPRRQLAPILTRIAFNLQAIEPILSIGNWPRALYVFVPNAILVIRSVAKFRKIPLLEGRMILIKMLIGAILFLFSFFALYIGKKETELRHESDLFIFYAVLCFIGAVLLISGWRAEKKRRVIQSEVYSEQRTSSEDL